MTLIKFKHSDFSPCLVGFGSESMTCVTISQSHHSQQLISSPFPLLYPRLTLIHSPTFSDSPQPVIPTPAHNHNLGRTSRGHNPRSPGNRSRPLTAGCPTFSHLGSGQLTSCNLLLQVEASSITDFTSITTHALWWQGGCRIYSSLYPPQLLACNRHPINTCWTEQIVLLRKWPYCRASSSSCSRPSSSSSLSGFKTAI